MKKKITNFILFVVISLITIIIILSTSGIETNKFNKLIIEKSSQGKNINLKLETIKFKIDPKKLSLFLETHNPEIMYKNLLVPVKSIKAYVDFLSLLRSDPIIKKISISSEELDIIQISKLSSIIKPSTFKSLLNNKIKEGKLIAEIEIFLNRDGLIEDFIAKGTVKKLKVELLNNINLKETNLSFFADKSDILFKNIFGLLEDIKISEGDMRLNLENGIKLNSNFNSKINLSEQVIKKYSKFLNDYTTVKGLRNLKADLNNNFSIELDDTYKVNDYNYSITGKIDKSKFELLSPIKNNFIKEEIKNIYFSNHKIKTIFKPKSINISSEGKYSFDNLNFLKINVENNIFKDNFNLKLDFEYKKKIELELINYKKSKKSIANFSIDLEKKKNNININKLNFSEENNSINIKDLIFKDNKFFSFKNIEVRMMNNDFIIEKGKKIVIKGTKFDATNLASVLSKRSRENRFEKINGPIEIDFKNIDVPMSEKLQNFKLIGEIKKGQFVKISSKGDYGGNNFLDISMKKNKNNNKKYLEIYSDLTRPLLSDYSFFKGLSGGKLIFTSIIEDSKSNSKLKIENFKVVNAPGVIKLLSLADLGGLADLAGGEGLSFDILEINMEKNKNLLKLNEILALGPSLSVLMDGYQDYNGLTSLRGTIVPAKTLNNMISKIPVIGNIVIPKEVGEGLFGISFKMKGPKGNIKTTINPIKTLTPRFIQKIIEKNKETK
tara:strand:+ start:6416 stop:8587 length:2172 start_codon:yes stop_codon:yes gene_type:complete